MKGELHVAICFLKVWKIYFKATKNYKKCQVFINFCNKFRIDILYSGRHISDYIQSFFNCF
jgi:hypothetical protein